MFEPSFPSADVIAAMEAFGLGDALQKLKSVLLRTQSVEQPALTSLLTSSGIETGLQGKVLKALTVPGFMEVSPCRACASAVLWLGCCCAPYASVSYASFVSVNMLFFHCNLE